MKIGIPVKCQNGHQATWVIELDGLDVIQLGVDHGDKCRCPKHALGEGYTAAGEPFVLGVPAVHDDTLPLDPWGLLEPCSECGDAGCNGECQGDDTLGGD